MLLQASELEDLEDEANMPLEQLMAKYGYTASTDVATPSHPSLAPLVNAHSDPPPTPAGPSTDPSPPSLPPHSSPQGPAKPMSSGSKAEAPAESLTIVAKPTAAAKGEDVQAMQIQQQAEQATAAGMDAFEHSQALAERRASGSQAGPSSPSFPSAPAPGKHTQPAGMAAATRPFVPFGTGRFCLVCQLAYSAKAALTFLGRAEQHWQLESSFQVGLHAYTNPMLAPLLHRSCAQVTEAVCSLSSCLFPGYLLNMFCCQ